jgi:phosphatidate cytidylyltransferase
MECSLRQGILLPKRELFALVAIPIVVAVIVWLPAWVLLVVLSAAVTIAADELLGMARGSGIPARRWLSLVCLLGLLAASWRFGAVGFVWMAGATLMMIPTAQLAHRDRPRGGLAGSAVACFTVLYLGFITACLGWIRLWPEDSFAIRLILFCLSTIWIGDSGAYYVGRRFGRHKMSPRVSPNKTWEGLIGGVVTALSAAAALKLVLALDLEWSHLMSLAAILSVATPIGDLVESQFKRDTGVKDSSTLLPGHGGLLDRTDSLLYAAPPVLAYLLAAGLVG